MCDCERTCWFFGSVGFFGASNFCMECFVRLFCSGKKWVSCAEHPGSSSSILGFAAGRLEGKKEKHMI